MAESKTALGSVLHTGSHDVEREDVATAGLAEEKKVPEKKSVKSKDASSHENYHQRAAAGPKDEYFERNRFTLNPQDRALLMSAAIQKMNAPSLKAQGDYLVDQSESKTSDGFYDHRNHGQKYHGNSAQHNFTLTKAYASFPGSIVPRISNDSGNPGFQNLGKRQMQGLGPLDYQPEYGNFESSMSQRIYHGSLNQPPEYSSTLLNFNRYPAASRYSDPYASMAQMKTVAGDTYIRKSASKPPVIKEGDWHCQECQNINWARRTTCNL